MQTSRNIGILLAFTCLLILGIMPLLSNARPQGSDGLSFAIWPTFWQVAAALPLFLFEYFTRKNHPSSMSWQNVTMNTGIIALISGCLFGLATYIYLVAAEKAGAVNFMLAL
jgi:drug/metabolite transporter (DMT)-like permease